MHTGVLRLSRVSALSALLALLSSPCANAFARTPSISGNWGIALALVVAAAWMLVLLIRGVLFLERRDAWLGRGAGDDYYMRD
jgi:hypothetical protein